MQDWPLALCNPASIDINEDLELTDNVYPLNVDESVQIHYNENQDWCYLSKQAINEVLIFRGGDSALGLSGGVYPLSSSSFLRDPYSRGSRSFAEKADQDDQVCRTAHSATTAARQMCELAKASRLAHWSLSPKTIWH